MITAIGKVTLFFGLSLIFGLFMLGNALATPTTIDFAGAVTNLNVPDLNAGATFVPGDNFSPGSRFTGTLIYDSDLLPANSEFFIPTNDMLLFSLKFGPQSWQLGNNTAICQLFENSAGDGYIEMGTDGGLYFTGDVKSTYFEHLWVDFTLKDIVDGVMLPKNQTQIELTSLSISAGPYWHLQGSITPLAQPVPEPHTLILVAVGFGGFFLIRSRLDARNTT
ncbi:hypothetical protein [Geomonas propionica]|uniref:PEP-CTERM protein-sorting domain-containing protein n=1 Tax=Geomonas propionica TaxID=2798582 RepID=A0ABS0YSW4_9BACT|nr:hypothetical protein [Geomonas propionica]MBJ6801071.1 hypothetical protein [Geomonas propionica]